MLQARNLRTCALDMREIDIGGNDSGHILSLRQY
jgi:hypothetical protein